MTTSVIIEHPKALHKLSKAMGQAEKVSKVSSGKNSNRPLYSETKKVIFLFGWKISKNN